MRRTASGNAKLASGTGTSRVTAESSSMARILVGVSGGIAAYKACELVRRLREGVEFFQFLRTREDMIVS